MLCKNTTTVGVDDTLRLTLLHTRRDQCRPRRPLAPFLTPWGHKNPEIRVRTDGDTEVDYAIYCQIFALNYGQIDMLRHAVGPDG